MKRTKLDKRFFGSTRGRIVNLMRGTTMTVNELADEFRSYRTAKAKVISGK